jgi:hypothetical protein
MIALVCFIWTVLVSPFKSKSGLAAENAVLRHQVTVLQRKLPRRIQLTNADRLFFVQLSCWFPSILRAITIIQPETIVRWHRAGFRSYWRWKSRNPGGRPPITAELRALIRRMSVENMLWGAPRIRGELLRLGFVVAQSTVAKYMSKRGGPSGQTWGTLSAQPCAVHCRDGFVCGSDHQLCPVVRSGDRTTGSAGAGLDQCHKTSDGGFRHTQAPHRDDLPAPTPGGSAPADDD